MHPTKEDVAYFVNERESIRVQHDCNAPRPWTNDPILATYRFCNVKREDDKVTRWLDINWRMPYAGHQNMTVAMLLARMINWPPTLAHIGFPTEWDPYVIMRKMEELTETGVKVWGSAYVITTCGKRMDKALYVVGTVCDTVVGGGIAPRQGDTLQTFWERLRSVEGLGAGFLAAQVVADLKYVDEHLLKADDWETFAVSGPGSRRGLNRYYGMDKDAPYKSEQVWYDRLERFIIEVSPLVHASVGKLHYQDWQNVLCELDKYWRVKNGEGRPKQLYRPENAYQVCVSGREV